MRYAIFTDIHANLEALEAVLAKIDELAQQESIDQIWFLGDLVGYGPNPNECITKLRERTDIIIAGNHDWAAVGKIDLDDFSAAARISAEWTAQQLTEEHREFLTNLPERIVLRDCTLVHGSPYGPLWEYLTSEVLAERSFQYFSSRYCFVGHTHVPVIFQQPDPVAQTPTVPLTDTEQREAIVTDDDEETQKVVVVRPTIQSIQEASLSRESTHIAPHTSDEPTETEQIQDGKSESSSQSVAEKQPSNAPEIAEVPATSEIVEQETPAQEQHKELNGQHSNEIATPAALQDETLESQEAASNGYKNIEIVTNEEEPSREERISDAEDRLNSEIEELLALLGLSQSMVQVTNEMLVPPEGAWTAPRDYRAIVNPGGVGQPRDGDPRAAFMIFDSTNGFTFYRVHYDFEKTQEKIIRAGLPPYLAARLGYGR